MKKMFMFKAGSGLQLNVISQHVLTLPTFPDLMCIGNLSSFILGTYIPLISFQYHLKKHGGLLPFHVIADINHCTGKRDDICQLSCICSPLMYLNRFKFSYVLEGNMSLNLTKILDLFLHPPVQYFLTYFSL